MIVRYCIAAGGMQAVVSPLRACCAGGGIPVLTYAAPRCSLCGVPVCRSMSLRALCQALRTPLSTSRAPQLGSGISFQAARYCVLPCRSAAAVNMPGCLC